MSEPDARPLSALLLVAILCVPLVFCWLLFRRGYPKSLRSAALAYAVIMTGVGLMGRFGT